MLIVLDSQIKPSCRYYGIFSARWLFAVWASFQKNIFFLISGHTDLKNDATIYFFEAASAKFIPIISLFETEEVKKRK